MLMKKHQDPIVIEPATFRLVVQCINQQIRRVCVYRSVCLSISQQLLKFDPSATFSILLWGGEETELCEYGNLVLELREMLYIFSPVIFALFLIR